MRRALHLGRVHELALCEAVIEVVRGRVGDARVSRVRLAIGQLAGVLPEAMQFAFEVCAAGTGLAGARVEIDEVRTHLRCRECQREAAGVDVLLCSCGSADVELLAGNDLRVVEVELAAEALANCHMP